MPTFSSSSRIESATKFQHLPSRSGLFCVSGLLLHYSSLLALFLIYFSDSSLTWSWPILTSLPSTFHWVTPHEAPLQESCPLPVTSDWFISTLWTKLDARNSLGGQYITSTDCTYTSTESSAWPKVVLSERLLNGQMIEWMKMSGRHLVMALNEDLFGGQSNYFFKFFNF